MGSLSKTCDGYMLSSCGAISLHGGGLALSSIYLCTGLPSHRALHQHSASTRLVLPNHELVAVSPSPSVDLAYDRERNIYNAITAHALYYTCHCLYLFLPFNAANMKFRPRLESGETSLTFVYFSRTDPAFRAR